MFDQFIPQKPDLSFTPGLLTEWDWNEDRTKVMMTVREGVTWHDGSPFSAEDVVWSLARAAKQERSDGHDAYSGASKHQPREHVDVRPLTRRKMGRRNQAELSLGMYGIRRAFPSACFPL